MTRGGGVSIGSFFAMLTVAGSLLWVPARDTVAQTFLIDTGQGGTSSIGAPSLIASGSTTCSPQPACASNFQFLAAQFTLHEAATITALQAWMIRSAGGSIAVKIRADLNGLPSANAPPLLSNNSIFSKTYAVAASGTAAWVVFDTYNAVLAAGTYWLTLEPVANSQLNASLPVGVANPLAKYAFFANGNAGYAALPANQSFGVRIAGTKFDGIAFGTGTRTIENASAFGGHWSYDFIRSGTRDFVPVGIQGDDLTVSYIFVIPSGYVHARGKLVENGLSAGAYSFMSGPCGVQNTTCGTGAGRGVAFRTFQNMTNVAKTFRVNAVLTGSFGNGGGKAAAGIYAIDSTQFANTVNGSGYGAAEFLLRRDGLGALASNSASLTLATLFPPGAVLGSQFVTPSYPAGQVGTTPLSTGLFTIQPNATFMLLYDVSAYATGGGAVNFADTLTPAANQFSDAADAPVPEIVAVGPSAAPVPSATAIALTPAAATRALGTTITVEAAVTGQADVPVPQTAVLFSVLTGPNAGLSQSVLTDADGKADFTYAGNAAGVDTIQATIGGLQSNTAQATWQLLPVLNVSIAGSGSGTVTSDVPGIACPVDCQQGYAFGDTVALTAAPAAGSVFTGWLGGGCTGTNPVCNLTLNASASLSATFALAGTVATLDVDGSAPNSKYDALTDGLLALRYLLGLSGPELVAGGVGANASRTTGDAIVAYLTDIRPYLDVDGDGEVDAMTDGLLIVRFLFGLSGDSLIGGVAFAPNAIRKSATQVQDYLQTLMP